MVEYLPIEKCHLAGVIGLCEVEGLPSYIKDVERTWQALAAPGVTTVVAVDSERVVGFAQMQSDGALQAHLSLILIAPDRRRQGVATELIKEAFKRCGAERVDLITEDAEDFYRSFAHKEWFGFRIYPQYDKKTGKRRDPAEI